MQYQTFRSVSDNHMFVVCYDGSFYEDVLGRFGSRARGRGQHRGEVERLKPEFRLAPARDGYMLVKCDAAVFKREV
jgi:hypothetical protein